MKNNYFLSVRYFVIIFNVTIIDADYANIFIKEQTTVGITNNNNND
jgi:hypothetical protein